MRFNLLGDEAETGIRVLDDFKRKPFRRGAVDSFIMANKKYLSSFDYLKSYCYYIFRRLGNLSYLHIWHDNSGKGRCGSWYLKQLIVNDLQTKEKYYFICNKWLGVEKHDGRIERMIPVAGEVQKKEYSYILKKEATKSMTDGHLWLSVFTKPAYSAFSRVERISCCFSSIYIGMLLSILYYEKDSSVTKDDFVIGPFYLTTKQVTAL